jgi:hypothetical protein
MYDEPSADLVKAVSKQSEVLLLISDIKNELYRTREKLQPVLQAAEQLKQTGPSGSTALLQELSSVLEIIKDLNQDIYL